MTCTAPSMMLFVPHLELIPHLPLLSSERMRLVPDLKAVVHVALFFSNNDCGLFAFKTLSRDREVALVSC